MNTSELNNFLVILIYGSLVLLSLLELTNPLKVNKKANAFFGVFLFLWSTFWLDEVFSLVKGSNVEIHPLIFVQVIQFLTPIVFYFSVLFFTNPAFKFKLSDVKYAVLPVIFLVNLLFRYFGIINAGISALIFIGLILVQALFYTGLSYFTIRKHQRRIQMFSSNTEEINLNWLEYIILVIFVMNIGYIIYNLFYDSTSLNFFINIIFLLVVYFVACYCLRQKEIYPAGKKVQEELISISSETEAEAVKKKLISDEDFLKIKHNIEAVMQSEKPYLDSELNLIRLSELLSISTHHLSYVINKGFNKNFFQYVNEYRIEYAKILLKNDKNNKLSILGIAYESGFNSKTSFNNTFKKLTDQTPSEFKKTSSSL
ncbi:AraC-like DNA-binding protein [Chryseobacterium sp. H1D6B]|uniref:helix-turn-helix domain-containing protein n=1 Tax=Chryseobacterium sp. H1D6B TaxID=2940588 RepID=UPI0015CC0375|nr:AraC family transcriptional regulator [Chryseobacterium sp. H1D6B]MDH6254087.1 AraC-like DNA-binding protein [Chryseobacterium sp. H1D6B]